MDIISLSARKAFINVEDWTPRCDVMKVIGPVAKLARSRYVAFGDSDLMQNELGIICQKSRWKRKTPMEHFWWEFRGETIFVLVRLHPGKGRACSHSVLLLSDTELPCLGIRLVPSVLAARGLKGNTCLIPESRASLVSICHQYPLGHSFLVYVSWVLKAPALVPDKFSKFSSSSKSRKGNFS